MAWALPWPWPGLGALRYVGSEPLVRPPGGQDEENLVSRCVHCYRCIEACPEKVIRGCLS